MRGYHSQRSGRHQHSVPPSFLPPLLCRGIIICVYIRTGTPVKSEDVNLLVRHLRDHAYKWREIGSSLDFRYCEMENISHSNPRATTQQLLMELLSQWSQWPTADHPDIVPTVEKLCDALHSGLVGLGAEANDLCKLMLQKKHQ